MTIGIDTLLTPTISPSTWVAPLNSGDRLVRAEFERRYAAHPALTKAE
jgi:hypothetical protein